MSKHDNRDKKKRVAEIAGRVAARTVGGTAAVATTYGLVGALGTASTGTAISTLSGAAATKATLALLGGGTVAAGGLGIVGGTVVLATIGFAGAYGATKIYRHLTKPSKKQD